MEGESLITKKYKLHCFRCGYHFYNKKEVHRNQEGWPICGECMADINFGEIESYLNEPDPGSQEEIDKANLRKYGEY